MKDIKTILKLVVYGSFLNYHLKKGKTLDMKFQTLHRYHCEKSEYFYEKIFGKKL